MMGRPRGLQSHYRPVRSQMVSVGTSSTASTAVGSQIQVVLVTPTVDMFIELGDSPTALDNGTSMFLVANTPVGLTIHPGEQIAAISASSGILYITEMSQ